MFPIRSNLEKKPNQKSFWIKDGHVAKQQIITDSAHVAPVDHGNNRIQAGPQSISKLPCNVANYGGFVYIWLAKTRLKPFFWQPAIEYEYQSAGRVN